MKKNNGFGIIEVFVVLTILGIVLAVIAPLLPKLVKQIKIANYATEAINRRSMTKEDGKKFLEWVGSHIDEITIETPEDIKKAYLKYKLNTALPDTYTETTEVQEDTSEDATSSYPESVEFEECWAIRLQDHGVLYKYKESETGYYVYVAVVAGEIKSIAIK